MNKQIVQYIREQAASNGSFFIEESLGMLICPKIKDIKSGIYLYHNSVIEYIALYETNKSSFLYTLITNNKISEFAMFASNFYQEYNDILLDENGCQLQFIKKTFKDDKEITKIVGCINNSNIEYFIDFLKVIHHKMDNDYLEEDNEKDSKMVREMKKRIKEEKKKIEKFKAENNISGGLTLYNVMSSLCARHNSINPINISELTYFQLIDQFAMVNKIDSWNINMTALAYGNIPKDKQSEIKHYTCETDE
jgi:hypothetical protein